MLEGLTGLLLMMVAGIIGNRADGLATSTFQRFMPQLKQYREAGQLPHHLHIERGTIRACLMATQICIQQMIDEGNGSQLDDAPKFDGRGLPLKSAAALSALRDKLNELIVSLECNDVRAKPAKDLCFEAAIAEGTLVTSEPLLDLFAGNLLSTLNKPSSPKPGKHKGVTPDSSEVRAARKSLIPNLDDAVVAQALQFGNWSHKERQKEVAAAIRAAFFSEEELWVTTFALCYADEIRVDSNLYKLAVVFRLERLEDALAKMAAGDLAVKQEVTALGSDIEAAFSSFDLQVRNATEMSARAAEAAEGVLTLVRRQFSIREKLVFFKPGIATAAPFSSAYKPIYFAEEEDDFIGRDLALAELRKELLHLNDNSPVFQWAAICGGAGSGKSRLALQILKTEGNKWRLSGFVRPDFLQKVEFALKDLSMITGPALFVIDYADRAPEACCRFLERCALLAEDAPFPVRAIVLLRRSNDRFFEAVRRERDGAVAYNSQVPFSPPSGLEDDESRALFLGGLTEEETATLMRCRIERIRIPQQEGITPIPSDFENDKLLSTLRRYDKSLRPLFAVIVADAFARDEPLSESTSDTTLEEERLALFWGYLEHQYKKRWSTAELDAAECEWVDRHLSFLALSTMCRGLMINGWSRLLDDPELGASVAALLPKHPFRFDPAAAHHASAALDEEHLLATLSGATRSNLEDDPYPILEPDLVGESLILFIFDDARGKSLCGQALTAQLRRQYLREYAWHADPSGTAFFTVLMAQDFPEHTAKLNWLLPKKPHADTALDRARLFRSLVLTTIAPLSVRAATLADVTRMKKLIEFFPTDTAEAEGVQHERVMGVGDIAEQLSFIINKSFAPTTDVEVTPISDKLGKRLLSFDHAASRVAPNSSTDEPPSDGQAIFRLTSDAEAVAAALELLRQLYDEAIEPTFSDGDYELRRLHALVVCHALSSVFWEYRNNESKYGFATVALSEEEREARNLLAARCGASVATKPQNENSVAIAAMIMRRMLYAAAEGDNMMHAQEVFKAIQSLCSSNGFTNTGAISEALGLLNNYAWLQIYLRTKAKEKLVDADPLTEISEVADRLLKMETPLGNVSDSDRQIIISRWCDTSNKLAGYERQCERPTLSYLRNCEATYLGFLDRQGSVPVTTGVIELYNQLFQACRDEGTAVDELLTSYTQVVRRHGFDRVSTNHQYWDNLRHHFWQLRGCEVATWPDVCFIFEAATQQIGDRAHRDLTKMLIYVLPDSNSLIERDLWLANLAQSGGQTNPQPEDARKLRMAIMTQHLVSGHEDAAFSSLEESWNDGTSDDDVMRRTDALVMLQIFLCWYGHEHPRVSVWRQRLIDLFIPSTEPLPENSVRHIHDKMATEIAACFARLEIMGGGRADDWLMRSLNS